MACFQGSGHLVTAVERRSGYTLIGKVPSKTASRVADCILKLFGDIRSSLLRTFTFDNGSEFSSHERLERDLGVKCYFADPYNSGAAGSQ